MPHINNPFEKRTTPLFSSLFGVGKIGEAGFFPPERAYEKP
jgi:hypothetical protein